MLKNLFGGGKKKEFFLELDDAKGSAPAEAKVETPAQPAVASQPEATPQPEQHTQPEATTAEAEVEQAPEKPAKAKKSKKKSAKKAAKKEAPKMQPTPAATNGQVIKKEEPKEVEFATKFYMVPTSRRRPGPSLSPFKNMARQVKAPRG